MKNKIKTPLLLRLVPQVFPWVEKFLPFLANRFFVYLFFKPFRFKTPEKELLAAKQAEQFIIEVDGKKIQCYSWGSGPVVLLLHGWAGRGTQLRKFIEPLNLAGYRAVAMDGPAHGKSEGRLTNLDGFRNAINALVKEVGGAEAIIAHSFGGVATLYAVSTGLTVNTIINIASPTIGDEIIKNYLRTINGSQKTGEAFKQYVLKKSGKPFEKFSALEFIKHVPEALNLLLIHDQDDKEVIIAHPQALVKQFPRAQFYQTSGLGHNRILKDEKVIEHAVTFIQSHSSKAGTIK